MVRATLFKGVSDARETVCIQEGRTVLSALPEGTDAAKVRVLVDGRMESPMHTVRNGETIAVRILPSADFGFTEFMVVVGLIATVVGGVKLYNQRKEIERQQEEIDRLRAGMSGTGTVSLPWLKGASNAVATGKSQPYIIGEHFIAPYIMNSGGTGRGYNILSGPNGNEVHYVAVLNAGFGKQVLKKLYVGDSEALDFHAGTEPQEGVSYFNGESPFASESSLVEVSQDGEPFLYGEFNENVVQQTVNDQLKKKDSEGEHPLYYTIPTNSMSADVCILINGLIAYTSSGEKTDRTVSVKPAWRVRRNGDWEKGWHEFGFRQSVTRVTRRVRIRANHYYKLSYRDQSIVIPETGTYWEYNSDYSIRAGIAGMKWHLKNRDNGRFEVTEEAAYEEDADGILHEYGAWDYDKATTIELVGNNDWAESAMVGQDGVKGFPTADLYYRDRTYELSYELSGSCTTAFTRRTKEQMRFNAHTDFTPQDVLGAEEIQIRVTTPTEAYTAGNCYDDVYVQWVQARTYDTEETTSDCFAQERIMSSKGAALSTLIGVRIKSTASNEDKLSKIGLVTQGVARTWNGREWSAGRVPTRNPAAWLLEVLTSQSHLPSRVDESEIDLESMGELYQWCESRTVEAADGTAEVCPLTCDMVIAQAETKEQVLEKILSTCQSALYRNSAGLIAVATDKAQENAIGLLNPQNLISFRWERQNARSTDQIDIKYTDHETWGEATYPVRLGDTLESSTQVKGNIIREMSVTGIETARGIVRYGRYVIACDELRRHTVRATVGMEGTFYTPWSKVLVQHPSMNGGLGHAVIKAVLLDEALNITGLELYQNVVLDGESEYSIVVQCSGTDEGGTPLPTAYGIENTAGTSRVVRLLDAIPNHAGVKPRPGDILSWGYEPETVTTPYMVVGVEPAGQNTYTLTLTDYNEAIYDTGKVPAYRPNLTKRLDPSPAQIPDPGTMFREYATKENVASSGYQDFQFAVSQSADTYPADEGEWHDAPPAVGEGQFLWMRTRWVKGGE